MGNRDFEETNLLDSIIYDDDKMKQFLMEVSRRISEERKKRGISIMQLAEIANVSASHIFKVEAAQCEIGLKALLKISKALGVKPEEFLPEEMLAVNQNQEQMTTNGEKFDLMTMEADPETIDLILAITDSLMRMQKSRKQTGFFHGTDRSN